MARPNSQTQAKRQRERAKIEKREAKNLKRAARKAEKESPTQPDVETETPIADIGVAENAAEPLTKSQ